MSDELPEGWAQVPPLRVAALLRGVSYEKGEAKAAPAAGLVALLRANNITDRGLVFDDLQHVPAGRVSDAQRLQVGDVVIAMSSGSKSVVGKAAALNAPWSGTFGAFCGALRPNPALDARYFGLFFETKEYRDAISEMSAGTNINNLKRDYFDQLRLPVAPLAEQRNIVAKVEALLEQVRRATDRLDRVLLLLKRFRLAVLSEACSGDLTKPWRESIPSLSPWDTARVGDLCPVVQYGYTASARAGSDGPRFLRITDIQGGCVDWASVPTCDITPTDARKFALHHGDIVFARSGATTGKSYLLTDCPPAVFASYLIRVRAGERVLPNYLHLCFQTASYWHYIADNVAGNAQPNCNATKLADLEVLVPPLEEQAEIVRRVDGLFAIATSIEQRVERAAARARRMPQAILSKAFAGELVPTEADLARAEGRDYETAEELLGRVHEATRQVPAASTSTPRRTRLAR